MFSSGNKVFVSKVKQYASTLRCHKFEFKVIEQLIKDNFSGKNAVDHQGYNLLHYVVSEECSHTLNLLESMLGSPFIRLIGKTNQWGLSPLVMACLSETNNSEFFNKIVEFEHAYIDQLNIKSIAKKLKPKDVLHAFHNANYSIVLSESVKVCCFAVNVCRHHIKYSSSHPEAMLYDLDCFTTVVNALSDIGTSDKSIKDCLVRGVANCHQFALLAMDFLVKKNSRYISKIELVVIDNGDHAFLVINRKSGELNKFETWNLDTIIVDPWIGAIYPVTDIKANLFNYNQIRVYNDSKFVRVVNALEEFNPRYHKLALWAVHMPMFVSPNILSKLFIPKPVRMFDKDRPQVEQDKKALAKANKNK